MWGASPGAGTLQRRECYTAGWKGSNQFSQVQLGAGIVEGEGGCRGVGEWKGRSQITEASAEASELEMGTYWEVFE